MNEKTRIARNLLRRKTYWPGPIRPTPGDGTVYRVLRSRRSGDYVVLLCRDESINEYAVFVDLLMEGSHPIDKFTGIRAGAARETFLHYMRWAENQTPSP